MGAIVYCENKLCCNINKKDLDINNLKAATKDINGNYNDVIEIKNNGSINSSADKSKNHQNSQKSITIKSKNQSNEEKEEDGEEEEKECQEEEESNSEKNSENDSDNSSKKSNENNSDNNEDKNREIHKNNNSNNNSNNNDNNNDNNKSNNSNSNNNELKDNEIKDSENSEGSNNESNKSYKSNNGKKKDNNNNENNGKENNLIVCKNEIKLNDTKNSKKKFKTTINTNLNQLQSVLDNKLHYYCEDPNENGIVSTEDQIEIVSIEQSNFADNNVGQKLSGGNFLFLLGNMLKTDNTTVIPLDKNKKKHCKTLKEDVRENEENSVEVNKNSSKKINILRNDSDSIKGNFTNKKEKICRFLGNISKKSKKKKDTVV